MKNLFRKITLWGQNPSNSELENQQIWLLNVAGVILFFILLFYALLAKLITDLASLYGLNLAHAAILIIAFAFNFYGYTHIGKYIASLSAPLFMWFYSLFFGNEYMATNYLILVSVCISLLWFNKALPIVIISLFSFLALTSISYWETHYPPLFPHPSLTIFYYPNIALSFFFVLFPMLYILNLLKKTLQNLKESNIVVQQTNEELHTTLDMVAKQRNDIISSINYALRIQNAILPKEQEIQKYFPESFVLFRPKDIVSGDFYWFAKKQGAGFSGQDLENSQKLNPESYPQDPDIYIIVVADCTGHGVSGAFMTMIGNNMLNHIVHDLEITQPNEILNQMTPLLEKTLLHSEGNVKDGMDISILTIETRNEQNLSGLRDLTGLKVSYAGAMNPLYYVQNQEFVEIKADKVPIGGKQKEGFSYQNHNLNLLGLQDLTGLTVYLCTDGFQDQFGGTEKRKFMVSKFKKLLFEISEKPMVEQKEVLETTISDWISEGNEKQTDDICVLGIRL